MTTMLSFLAVWAIYMSVVTLLLARFGPTLLRHYRATTVNALWVFISIAWVFPLRPALPTKFTINTPAPVGAAIAENTTKVVETAGGWQWTSLVLGILALVWVLGSLVELIRTWRDQRRFSTILKRWGRTVTDRKILSIWDEETTRLGLTTAPDVLSLPQISSPMVIGIRNARLVIPADAKIPPRPVLRHEAAHIRRRDPLLRLILRMVTIVQWWNPFARLAVRSALQSAEIACDEKALNGVSKAERADYADLLVTALHNHHQTVPLAPSFKERKKIMKNRLSAILDTKRKRIGSGIAGAALVSLVVVGVPLAAASADSAASTNLPTVATANSNGNGICDGTGACDGTGVCDGTGPHGDGTGVCDGTGPHHGDGSAVNGGKNSQQHRQDSSSGTPMHQNEKHHSGEHGLRSHDGTGANCKR